MTTNDNAEAQAALDRAKAAAHAATQALATYYLALQQALGEVLPPTHVHRDHRLMYANQVHDDFVRRALKEVKDLTPETL